MSPKAIVEAVNRELKKGAEDFGVIARSILCCMRQMPVIHQYHLIDFIRLV